MNKSTDLYIGAHVSAAGGVANAPGNARKIDASAFALFTRNQRRWTSAPYTAEMIDAFREEMTRNEYTADHVIPHASYLVNLGSPDDDVRHKSIAGLADELDRTVALGLRWLNFHPGTSKGELDEADTLIRIAEAVDRVLDLVDGGVLVLENTAGQGTSIGRTFEQLARIIEISRYPERLAICVDTCHAFAAGYDIRSAAGWAAMIDRIAEVVGIDKLVALHLNDSAGELGSHKDRHKPIGEGEIGLSGFRAIVNDPRMAQKPMILETPDTDKWAAEISLLRDLISST